MDRFSLTDAQWEKMQPFCLGKPTDPGRTGGDCRLFTEAVLWIARTGSPWRDLPASFGNWNTVFKRFRDWVKADVFKRMFDAVSDEPDMEYAAPSTCWNDVGTGHDQDGVLVVYAAAVTPVTSAQTWKAWVRAARYWTAGI